MEVPKTSDNATLLLAAAYKLGGDAFDVVSTGSGFTASDKIMQEAGFMEKPEPKAEKKAPTKTADSKSASKSTSKK